MQMFVGSSDQPVKRSIRLFVSSDALMAVLQTDAPGGFWPPSKAFDPTVKTMLCLRNRR